VARDIKSRVVQMPARGQITIPTDMRRQLGLEEGDLLQIRLIEGKIEIEPLAAAEKAQWREHTEAEIKEFLAEDRIDEDTAAAVRGLLAKGEL